MKRINPNTGLPYKRGDLGEDGKLFFQYITSQLDHEGFYKLKFGYKEWIERSNKNARAWQKLHKEIHNKRNNMQRYASPRKRAVAMITSAKNRAKKKGIDFNLTKLWLVQKLENGFCELSGLPFDFSQPKNSNFNPMSPSIDRIDSKKGYTFDNCRIILTSLNVALSEYGLDHYLLVAKKVIRNTK